MPIGNAAFDRERRAFEAWFEGRALGCGSEHSNWFRHDADGEYAFDHVSWAWEGWQARSMTLIRSDQQLNQAFNEGDGSYRP